MTCHASKEPKGQKTLWEINSWNSGVFEQCHFGGCKQILQFLVTAYENTKVMGRRDWPVFPLLFPMKAREILNLDYIDSLEVHGNATCETFSDGVNSFKTMAAKYIIQPCSKICWHIYLLSSLWHLWSPEWHFTSQTWLCFVNSSYISISTSLTPVGFVVGVCRFQNLPFAGYGLQGGEWADSEDTPRGPEGSRQGSCREVWAAEEPAVQWCTVPIGLCLPQDARAWLVGFSERLSDQR